MVNYVWVSKLCAVHLSTLYLIFTQVNSLRRWESVLAGRACSIHTIIITIQLLCATAFLGFAITKQFSLANSEKHSDNRFRMVHSIHTQMRRWRERETEIYLQLLSFPFLFINWRIPEQNYIRKAEASVWMLCVMEATRSYAISYRYMCECIHM